MIITCASCLTKFNLDDSRIHAEGIKVRCSRCKHVFYVVPPPETKAEIIEDIASFAKYHEDLMEPGEKKVEVPREAKVKKEEIRPEEKEEEEERFLFSDKVPAKEAEKLAPPRKIEEWVPSDEVERLAPPERGETFPAEERMREERRQAKPSRPKPMLRVEKRGPARFLALLIVLVLLVFGLFYLWSELGGGGKLTSYVDYPLKKISELWNQVWGTEQKELILGDLNRYDDQIEGLTLSIVEGTVKNQSRFTKKYIKIRISIFDQDKLKVAEKETTCGRTIDREELMKQPPEFFRGEMVIQPQTEEEMITPPGKTTPFMVIFKDLPAESKNFKPEILEAPNL